MSTFFDYLDAYLLAYRDGVGDAGDVPAGVEADGALAGEVPAGPEAFDDQALWAALHEVALVFGSAPDGSAPDGNAPDGGLPGGGSGDGAGSPADAWLSGHEWSGEAEIGGGSLTSGTVDPSGGENSVYAVDGEVLDLPD